MNVIQIEELWKEYRLGVIGHGTLTHDFQSWWARVRGKEDPNSKIPLSKSEEMQITGDRFWALRDINLEVKQGEVLGIIGKNGAGKSTLLKILSRVTAPSRGIIKVKGRIASLLEVGTGFHPELTGKENIFMNGAIFGMSKKEIDSKIEEIIEFSGVEAFIETPVKRYSSGMYVRLAFAVAAHLDPEILIVDEVLAVGDAAFQKKCLGKMEDISGDGRTILVVSHNMGSLKRLTTRCLYLADGKVLSVGDTKNMIELYLKNGELISFVDVEQNPRTRPEYGVDIRICKIEPMANDRHVFLFGQDLNFSIQIKSKIEKVGLRFRIILQDLLGESIVTILTPENLSFIKNISTNFRLEITNLILAPGRYRIVLSIGFGSLKSQQVNIDEVIGPAFEIAQVGVEGNQLLRWRRSWGSIYHNQVSVSQFNK